MHAKSGLRVVLKWKIYRPDSVIAAVIRLGAGMRFLTLAVILVFAGCEHSTDVSDSNSEQNESKPVTQPLDQPEILEIAKAEIKMRENWTNDAEYEIELVEKKWDVIVWRLPKTPGGQRYITIDDLGNVIEYTKGK